MRVAATTHNRYGIFHETGCMVRGAAGSQSPTNERSSKYPPERSGMTTQPSLEAPLLLTSFVDPAAWSSPGTAIRRL